MSTAARPGVLGGDPYTSLSVHFGMLLGVSDLETLAGHTWAKIRLHNAWLHGEGVVWGYGVDLDTGSGEVRVEAGLALDGAGRELALPVQSCVHLPAWYDEHVDELTVDDEGRFTAHVVARYRACLARPVPAMVDTCDPGSAETAYSRVQETVELFLRPGPAPDRVERYPRLRRLLGLPGPDGGSCRTGSPDDDAAVDAALDAVANIAPHRRPARWLALVRWFAAADTIALRPAGAGPWPVAEQDAEVVLAELGGLSVGPGAARTVDGWVDPSSRWSHVAGTTLTELAAFGPPLDDRPRTGDDAGGPRVVPESVRRADDVMEFELTVAPLPNTLLGGIRVSALDPDRGWQEITVTYGDWSDGDRVVRVWLNPTPDRGTTLRLVVRGTGIAPVVADVDGTLVPLAGVVGGPPGGRHEGHDAAFTIEGS